jgi:hypothetical protein
MVPLSSRLPETGSESRVFTSQSTIIRALCGHAMFVRYERVFTSIPPRMALSEPTMP